MKIYRFIAWFLSIFILILNYSSLQKAYPQTGNQSDVTGPNLQEIFSSPSAEENVDSNPNNQSAQFPEVDRKAFENQFIQAGFDQSIQLFEEFQAVEYSRYFGIKLYGRTAMACEISETLDKLAKITNSKPAIIYAVALEEQLDLLVIHPQSNVCSSSITSLKENSKSSPFVRINLDDVQRQDIEATIDRLSQEISNPRKLRTTSYQASASQIYQWLIQPLESSLAENQTDTLIFSLDRKIRSVPIASLYDGQKFLIEKYHMGLIPSFSLIDPQYRSIELAQLLGFGVSDGGKNQTLSPLPAVPIELSILENIWNSQTFINQNATVSNLQQYSKNEAIRMMHIATHAEFRSGDVTDSFIQLWDRNIGLDQLRELSQLSQWNQNPRVELLVLSACRTALGSEEAELGFSGLALQAGVKTAMGSLWYASDEGSLALMAEFYHQLQNSKVKVKALRQAQLNLLNGVVKIEDSELHLSNNIKIKVPDDFPRNQSFQHPYYWSAYALIGNWN